MATQFVGIGFTGKSLKYSCQLSFIVDDSIREVNMLWTLQPSSILLFLILLFVMLWSELGKHAKQKGKFDLKYCKPKHTLLFWWISTGPHSPAIFARIPAVSRHYSHVLEDTWTLWNVGMEQAHACKSWESHVWGQVCRLLFFFVPLSTRRGLLAFIQMWILKKPHWNISCSGNPQNTAQVLYSKYTFCPPMPGDTKLFGPVDAFENERIPFGHPRYTTNYYTG